jgi:hypothetical protein
MPLGAVCCDPWSMYPVHASNLAPAAAMEYRRQDHIRCEPTDVDLHCQSASCVTGNTLALCSA